MKQACIAILDFGSQTTQLIARRLRQIGVFSVLVACHATQEALDAYDIQGVILSGGPETAHDAKALPIPAWVYALGCPVLGICYGMQRLAHELGGRVCSGQTPEFGASDLECIHPWLQTLWGDAPHRVWMSHGDQVVQCPEGWVVAAQSKDCAIAAMCHQSKPYYAVQFHPEVTHTDQGSALLEDFALRACGMAANWQGTHLVETLVQDMRAQVGSAHVVLGLSGGVDSAVAAALLHQAIGDQLHCVFVDTGLLRLGEREAVIETFQTHFNLDLKVIDARETYLEALDGVHDPEAKRKIIGRLFIEHFDHAIASMVPKPTHLAQGTIYPDVIESSGVLGTAHVIKSHHNVGGLPEDMALTLVEPLKRLFKDEVRALGLTLGLPKSWVMRHPFPGPGLGVRIMGAVHAQAIERLQQADAIFIEALRAWGLYDQVSQAFAVYLPVSSVGVVGDQRVYADVIALRSVNTDDFMTATWSDLPHALLAQVSTDIVNQVSGISRVVYDVTGKPPATIEWE